MTRKVTTEDYVKRCIEALGNKYSYENTIYDPKSRDVTVTCKTHGDFRVHKFKHISTGFGCPECSGRGMDTTRAIVKAQEVHGTKYNYTKFVYKNAHTLATITCPVEGHGDFQQSYSNHVHAKAGCSKCKGGVRGTAESFASKAALAHKVQYDYSEVDYVNDKVKVKVGCPVHGSFKVCPTRHLQGQGCPKCATNGYNTSKPGYFYILTAGNTTKVGITNRDIEKRVKEVRRSSGKDFVVEAFISFSDGEVALNIESKLLQYLRANYPAVSEVYDGSTECFLEVDYGKLLLDVTKLCGEFLQQKHN